ncbi:MAG: hypothetical protein JZU50_08280 [Desulfobulbaceae bacterium]|jgi:hypothetical protein|nr:hypothetical protein [Desulfobulbaceae bacterium]
MPKSTGQFPAKAEQEPLKPKRVGVRTLRNLEDLRRLQAKLLKAFLAGDIDAGTYKASVYGCGQLGATMKMLMPSDQTAQQVEVVYIMASEDEAAEIAAMNRNIMDPPFDGEE